jgi:hypothetical protein
MAPRAIRRRNRVRIRGELGDSNANAPNSRRPDASPFISRPLLKTLLPPSFLSSYSPTQLLLVPEKNPPSPRPRRRLEVRGAGHLRPAPPGLFSFPSEEEGGCRGSDGSAGSGGRKEPAAPEESSARSSRCRHRTCRAISTVSRGRVSSTLLPLHFFNTAQKKYSTYKYSLLLI